HDFDQVVTRRQALENLVRGGALPHRLREVLDDRQVDVRLEQGHADLAQPLADLVLREMAVTAQSAEDHLKPFAQGVEHGGCGPPVAQTSDSRRPIFSFLVLRYLREFSLGATSRGTRSTISRPCTLTRTLSSAWMSPRRSARCVFRSMPLR